MYFCVFVNAKRQGGLIHLIRSTNESFIDYYIYYRHAHLFSQKHKNTKMQNMSTKASLHDLCQLTKHLNFFYTPPGAWHGKNYGMAWQKNFPRHAKKYGIHHQIHLFQKNFTNKRKIIPFLFCLYKIKLYLCNGIPNNKTTISC